MKILMTLLFMLTTVVSGVAATWHVAQDGSGDFTVIQDAIDAASPGDVIRVHSGRYTEMTANHDVWGNGLFLVDAYVWVDKCDLTFLGDGTGDTIIGPTEYPEGQVNELYGIAIAPEVTSTVAVSGFQLEYVHTGIMAWNDRCELSDCSFQDMGLGVRLYTESGASIIGCEFDELGSGLLALPPTAGVSLQYCAFTDNETGATFIGTVGTQIISCDFFGHNGALSIQQGATVFVEDCAISGSVTDNSGVYVSLGGQAHLHECTVEGFEVGLWVTGGGAGSIVADSCIVAGSTGTCIWNYGGIVEIHDSTILNGGGWSVLCNNSTNPDCSIDMTNNHWGTDSQDQIEAWISDAIDNPDLCCTVDFVPFNGPVATEARSWGSVKGLFEGGGGE